HLRRFAALPDHGERIARRATVRIVIDRDGHTPSLPRSAPHSFARSDGAGGMALGAGKITEHTSAPTPAPTIWAVTNPGTWLMAMPAKVVVNPRASVRAGLAKDVDDVNQ